MGRVLETKVDTKGLVRTCIIGVRPRDSRESSLPYKVKDLLRMTVPVQRLCVISPAEQWQNSKQEHEIPDPYTGYTKWSTQS